VAIITSVSKLSIPNYPRVSPLKRFVRKISEDSRRSPARDGETSGMTQHGDVEQLERHLLARGVGSLTADRHRCIDCERTPLVGERIHVYEHSRGIVCELCSQLRRRAPLESEIVRHSELGHTVRLTARAA
jgi:hypothetical protein